MPSRVVCGWRKPAARSLSHGKIVVSRIARSRADVSGKSRPASASIASPNGATAAASHAGIRRGGGACPSPAIISASSASVSVPTSDTLNTWQPGPGFSAAKAMAAQRFVRDTTDFCVSPRPMRQGLPARICRTNAARLAPLPGPYTGAGRRITAVRRESFAAHSRTAASASALERP